MKRVVITGLGALTPIGNSVESLWLNARNGVSGAAQLRKFDPSPFKTTFACELKDYQPAKYLDRKEIRRSDLFTQYALYAASEALTDSGLALDTISPYDIGVIWGSGQGGMQTFEEEVKEYSASGFKARFSPLFVPKLIANMALDSFLKSSLDLSRIDGMAAI